MKRKPVRIAQADATGFVVSAAGEDRLIPWHEVEQVTAFKRDLYTIDMVCLLLMFGAEQHILELNEQMEGYDTFVSAMDSNLAEAMPWAQWFMAVAIPAFAANALCIYRRNGKPDAIPPPPRDEPEPELSPIQRALSSFWDFVLRPLERRLYRSLDEKIRQLPPDPAQTPTSQAQPPK